MMGYPKVSIIIPVYNTEQYLEKCLKSVINQTLKDIEIICINDGSPDNSKQVLKRFAEKDERIIVVNQKNSGLSNARNNALDFVNGDYLMYVDSDDWIQLDTCAVAYQVAMDEQADVVLWSYIREFANFSLPKNIFKKNKVVFNREESAYELHRRMFGLLGREMKEPENADAVVTAWGKLYKTNIIKDNQIKFISTKIIGTEDALFNIYYFGYVNKSVCLNNNFYHYRKDNEFSLTSLYKERLFMQCQMKYDLMEMYITDYSLGAEYKKALDNRIAMSLLELGLNTVESEKKVVNKINDIKTILSQERYKNAYQKLNTFYLPIHWKLFYVCAKLNFATGIYSLLWIISKLRNRNKVENEEGYKTIKVQTEVR